MSGNYSDGFTRDFFFEVQTNAVKGYSEAFIEGIQPDLDTVDGIITVWGNKFEITLLQQPTELFMNSDVTADASVMRIDGLDRDFSATAVLSTLSSAQQKSLGIFCHIQDVFVADDLEPAGNVYVAQASALTVGVPEDSAVQSTVVSGSNMAHNGFYLVPRGKAAVMIKFRSTSDAGSKDIKIDTTIHRSTHAPLHVATYSVTNGGPLEWTFPVPLVDPLDDGRILGYIPEQTLIEFHAGATSNNTEVYVGAHLIVIDADKVEVNR